MGVSRDTSYRYRDLADESGIDARFNSSRRVPNLKNRTDAATEQVVAYAIEWRPTGNIAPAVKCARTTSLSPARA